jgi:hypothetical protein
MLNRPGWSEEALAGTMTASPRRGEGWGEWVRKFEKILKHPNPLILSFSPPRRRDAARRSAIKGADEEMRKSLRRAR